MKGPAELSIETFERVAASPELTLLRLSGRWHSEDVRRLTAPVLVLATPDGTLHQLNPLPGPDDAAPVSGPRGEWWRAAFPAPTVAVNNPGVAFTLFVAAAGSDLAVRLPVPQDHDAQAESPAGDARPALPERAHAPEKVGARSRRPPLWTKLPLRELASQLATPWPYLYLAVAYIVIFTQDYAVHGVPVKVPLVMVSLVTWYLLRGRTWYLLRGHTQFEFAVPVLVVAVVVPIVWSLIALERAVDIHSPDGTVGTFALQHASRFGYLLLYFPLADYARRSGWHAAQRVWLGPTLVLCAITWLVWLGHVVLGLDYGLGRQVLAFRGVLEVLPSGEFRVFFGNQVILIPAIALLMSRLLEDVSWKTVVPLGAVLTTAYHAHARGIWLGIVAVVLIQCAFFYARSLSPRWRHVAAFAVGLLAVAVLAAATTYLLTNPPDLSVAQRQQQAPELWRAFREHPLLGSGLGATLPSGFVRDPHIPWSFELTYLQILFQMGIVGLALVLWLPAVVFWRCRRPIFEGGFSRHLEAVAALSGIFGIFLASGTNPYLFSSYGMVAVVTTLVAGDRAAASKPSRIEPASPGATVHELQRGLGVLSGTRLRRGRRARRIP